MLVRQLVNVSHPFRFCIRNQQVRTRTNFRSYRRPITQSKQSKPKSNSVPVITTTTLLSFSFFGIGSVVHQDREHISKIVAQMESHLEDLLQRADQLFDENLCRGAFDELQKFTIQDVADVKWRQARALYSLARVTADRDKKNQLIRQSFELIDEAMKINGAHYAIHKWMAIIMDARSALDGIRARVQQLEKVQFHMKKAVELNPEDATSWYIMGAFSYELADMPWYQRKIVSAIFASPPTGSYAEALEHFKRAEEVKPNFYSMNLLMMGKCYLALKDNENAKQYLTLAANCRIHNDDDKKCKEEATNLLKKL